MFSSLMMILFPISPTSALLILEPDSFSGIMLALLFSLSVWFVFHSIVLLIIFIILSPDRYQIKDVEVHNKSKGRKITNIKEISNT